MEVMNFTKKNALREAKAIMEEKREIIDGDYAVLIDNESKKNYIYIRKNNIWELDIDEEDIGKPMYALYTGKEEKEEKEHIRNIYNGLWDKVPASLVDPISKIAQNNNMGEIIKVLMITSSGAEGISLKNVRYVHIMEPYWHPVRVKQVIGRARRIK